MKLEYFPAALNSLDDTTDLAASIYTEALKHVAYKDWCIVVTIKDGAGNAGLQAHFNEDGRNWATRRWDLNPYMTKPEIVRTAFKCIEEAEERGAAERFLYKGKSIFGSHFDVEKLHELCEMPDALNVRD